jgi:hypothetical protein
VSLAAAVAGAMRTRGLGDPAAGLAARLATTVMSAAFEQWVRNPDAASFQQVARDTLAQLQQITASG